MDEFLRGLEGTGPKRHEVVRGTQTLVGCHQHISRNAKYAVLAIVQIAYFDELTIHEVPYHVSIQVGDMRGAEWMSRKGSFNNARWSSLIR